MQKICIVNTSLANGGAERFGATLSIMLCNLGFDVHIVATKNAIEYNYSGKLFKLESENHKLTYFNKFLKLKSYFKNHRFDVIIDNRARSVFYKEYIIYKYIFKPSRLISVIHNYNIENYIPKKNFLAKMLYRSNFRLVAVSNEIKEIVEAKYNFKNVENIYNPVDIDAINNMADKNIECSNDYILYFGRLDNTAKNLTLLLKSYHTSFLSAKNVKLVILGRGKDYSNLVKLIEELDLNNDVTLLDYIPNPFPYVKRAIYTVLSSRYEGFPMSVIESLACGTPVISVDCRSGPGEVIKNKFNGLLVENFNQEALSSAMNTLIENKALYDICKSNAKKSVKHIDVEVVKKQWYNLIINEDKKD